MGPNGAPGQASASRTPSGATQASCEAKNSWLKSIIPVKPQLLSQVKLYSRDTGTVIELSDIGNGTISYEQLKKMLMEYQAAFPADILAGISTILARLGNCSIIPMPEGSGASVFEMKHTTFWRP